MADAETATPEAGTTEAGETSAPVELDRKPIETEDVTPEDKTNEGLEFQPIFDENITEAELRGEEPPPDDKKTAESESKEGEPEEKTSDDKSTEGDDGKQKADGEGTEEGTEDDTEKSESDDSKPDKPPKGYVPIQALKQARETIKAKNAKIAELTAKEDGEEEFKPLTETEYKDLLDNDPDAAALYNFRYNNYKEKSKLQDEVADTEAKLEQFHQSEALNAVEEIKREIPEFHTDKELQASMIKYATDNGFDIEYLGYMSKPGTMILPPGADAPFVLGKGAASLVKLIHKSMQNSPEALRASIREEVTKEVTDKVTKELMAKINNDTDAFASIGDIAGESIEASKTVKNLTEASMAKLPADKQKELLGG